MKIFSSFLLNVYLLGILNLNELNAHLSYMNSYVEFLSSNVTSLGDRNVWKAITSWRQWDSVLIKELLCPFCHVRTRWEHRHLWIRKQALARPNSFGALIFDFPFFRTVRNKYLLLFDPVHYSVLQMPE